MLDVQRERREKLFALRLTNREHAELMKLARKNDVRMVDLVRSGINAVLQGAAGGQNDEHPHR